MSNHDDIVGKLAWLYELQEFSESFQENLRNMSDDWDWFSYYSDDPDKIVLSKYYDLPGSGFHQLVCFVDILRQIESAYKEISGLLGDKIQIFSVSGETYQYLYVPNGKPLCYGFLTPGEFTLPSDRCHVFRIYLREEDGLNPGSSEAI